MSSPEGSKIPGSTYTGIFLIALSTLMYEILLTRIFSVTMGYHFAFMAVSLAMFGLTAGAIIVYIFPAKFPQGSINSVLARNSLYFSLTTVTSFLLHIAIPFEHGMNLAGITVTVFTYTVISIPFIFSGIVISLILTRFPATVNRLYAADLAGAALGCILVVIVLNVSGGPTGVIIAALIPAAASLVFLGKKFYSKAAGKAALGLLAAGIVFSAYQTVLVSQHDALLRLIWIRGEYAEKPMYEKWNSFSRVSIDGDSTKYEVPFGWGLSNKYDRSKKVRQLMLNVDAHSTTVLSHFTGDTSELSHLKYDVSNIANYLRPNSDVLIIGSGAGRDVLSSLAFGQKSVLGIEINKDMITAINEDFGGFTGHLDKYPNVEFVGDEARSYIQRMDKGRKFDIIQISVIDNWSASSSGAFVLTENALYTVETWKMLLDRLKPDGILTVTRFFRSTLIEHYKLINISADALEELGIKDIRKHMMIIKCMQQEKEFDGAATGTILISRSPFTEADFRITDSLNSTFDFETILSPQKAIDSMLVKLTSSTDIRNKATENFPIDIKAPSDDRPFIFHYMGFKDMLTPQLWKQWDLLFNAKALMILITLTVTMLVLSVLCVVVPLKMTSKKTDLKGSLPFFIFFMAIGLGFMLIEISQIQRLNIFLGHPTYSLAAALFTLLLSSGIGSWLGGRSAKPRYTLRFASLIIVLAATGIISPYLIEMFREYNNTIRISVSVAMLFPMGVCLGMVFPAGIKLAGRLKEGTRLTAWLWGINGVMSVLATSVAIIIAMNYGISASFWTGVGFYLVASIAVIYMNKPSS